MIQPINKKGFDANQLFIYITAVVVVGFVLIFGFKVIQQFMDTSEDLGELKVKDDLERVVSQVRNDHGSQRFFDLRVPNDFVTICFFDYASITGSCPEEIKTAVSPQAWVICENSVSPDAQKNNIVFVKSDGNIGTPYFVDGLRVQSDGGDRSEQYLCVEARLTRLRFEGFRRDAYVSESTVS